MSHPLCYTVRMMIKEDLFQVTLARWEDGTDTTTHILATDLERQAYRMAEMEKRSGTTRQTLSPIRWKKKLENLTGRTADVLPLMLY